MDIPWNAVIAATAGIIGALIPTVSAYMIGERTRHFQAVEKWNEKTWDKRFAAYQEFFAFTTEMLHLAESAGQKAEAMPNQRLSQKDYDKLIADLDKLTVDLGKSISRNLLLFEPGFQQQAMAAFKAETLVEIPESNVESLRAGVAGLERIIEELEKIAREHLSPKHLRRSLLV